MSIIEIEGLDGSGKETQSRLLAQQLCRVGVPARRITFPDYEHAWSLFVKMYLEGEFGQEADDVNAYTAASFYALDRYASFKKNWEKDYHAGVVLVADRYVGSNLIHQMCKLPHEEWARFMEWLEDFEYGKLGLPLPNRVLYLDMEPQTSRKLIERRYAGIAGKKDLHEQDFAYLLRCRAAAQYVVERCGWNRIACCDGEEPLPIEEIQRRIWQTAAPWFSLSETEEKF